MSRDIIRAALVAYKELCERDDRNVGVFLSSRETAQATEALRLFDEQVMDSESLCRWVDSMEEWSQTQYEEVVRVGLLRALFQNKTIMPDNLSESVVTAIPEEERK